MNNSVVGKTPVTALHEFCAKKSIISPKYEFIENDKIFYCNVIVEDIISEPFQGIGRSKQEAKHNAASNLIKHLKENNIDIDYIPQLNELHNNIPTKNAVALLRDLCLEKNHPFPQFDMIQQTGTPEAPLFKFRCIVASIQRFGSASTKKGAKQKAAQEMIDIVNSIPREGHQKKFKAVEGTATEDEINKKKIITYRQFIESDIKMEPPGTLLKDRHNYFKKLNPELLMAAKVILYNTTDYKSDQDKVDDFLKALHIKYSTELIPATGAEPFKFIQLLLSDYDSCFLAFCSNIYSEMLDYFKNMLL